MLCPVPTGTWELHIVVTSTCMMAVGVSGRVNGCLLDPAEMPVK